MARTTLERTENIRRPEEDSLTTAIAPGSESYREKSSAGRFYKGLLIPGSWRSTNLLKSPLRIALLAFLLPLGIRTIPEILAGPFPIGYDSIASYVPAMREWASGNLASQPSMMVGGPLVFAIFGSVYSLSRVDPILIVKITGPVVYGILGFAEYLFARRYFGWDYTRSLTLVMISSIYFVSLRLSWDLLRNTLGMAFLFLSLVASIRLQTRKSSIIFSSLSLITAATHVLTGAFLLALVGAQTARTLAFRKVALALAPATGWTLTSLALFRMTGIQLFSAGWQLNQLLAAYGLALYLFIPLIPVALIGARMYLPIVSRNWILICLAGILACTAPVSLSSQLIWPERWSFLLLFPLVGLATEGFFRIRVFKFSLSFPRTSIGYAWLILLLILAGTYISLPAREAMPFYEFVTPTSMLQSTIPVEESQSVANAFRWLSTYAPRDAVIVTTDVMYGWSSEYFTGQATVLWFHSGPSLQAALATAVEHGYTRIYTVWWADGQGWYGNPTVPLGFQNVHQIGEFGVFMLINQ
ncbi:MAG TPA: hypothetical protein VE955_03425 [Candidatus Dormibacteraeota bacterium]|nr:hypothetical protein [Candidatus Dormibacteraeota bacterium]